MPRLVTRLDPTRSGMYRLRGPRDGEIALVFILPAVLISSSGASLTLEFGADDGGYAEEPNQASSVGFDPSVPFTARLGPDGRGYVWLGATARPTPSQSPGLYEASVVLTVSPTGN